MTTKKQPKTPEPEKPRSEAQQEMSEKAKNRSPQYEQLSAQEQWEEDKELGILDWDGR